MSAKPRVFAGRYEIGDLLGEGSAARAFRARDQSLDRWVVVKVLTGETQVASADRLRDEARALAKLRHPHILEVYDTGVEKGYPYLVLEWAEKGSLENFVPPNGLEVEPAIEIAKGLLSGLGAAHAAGILHRDIKPENILLTREGIPKLADFGLAKVSGSSVKTRTGIVLGTAEYLAPELLQGEKPHPGSDLYSWAGTFYFLLFGSPPYQGDLRRVFHAASQGQLPEALKNSTWRGFFEKALNPDPKKRLDAQALLRELEVDRGAPTEAFPTRQASRKLLREEALAAHLEKGERVPPSRVQATQALGMTEKQGPRKFPRALLGVGLLATVVSAWGISRLGAPSTPKGPRRDPIHTWHERLRDVRARPLLRALHRQVDSKGEARPEDWPIRMRYERLGKSPEERVEKILGFWEEPNSEAAQELYLSRRPDRSRLRREAKSLPWVEEFARQRKELEDALRNSPRQGKAARLIWLLQELAQVDQYFRGWGEPPPFAADSLLEGLFRVRKKTFEIERAPKTVYRRDWDRMQPKQELYSAQLPAPPGRSLLYHWRAPPKRQDPYIFQNPEGLSETQKASLTFVNTSLHRVDVSSSGKIAVEFRLAAEQLEAGLPIRLAVVGANLLEPDFLQVEWSNPQFEEWKERRVDLWEDIGKPRDLSYRVGVGPEYELSFQFLPEELRSGVNRVEVRVQTLPGLPHREATEIFWIYLDVGDPES